MSMPGGHAGGGDHVAVVDEAVLGTHLDVRVRAPASWSSDAQCVVAGRPSQQPGVGVDQRSRCRRWS